MAIAACHDGPMLPRVPCFQGSHASAGSVSQRALIPQSESVWASVCFAQHKDRMVGGVFFSKEYEANVFHLNFSFLFKNEGWGEI